jgi:hypothetical protein
MERRKKSTYHIEEIISERSLSIIAYLENTKKAAAAKQQSMPKRPSPSSIEILPIHNTAY